MMSLAPAAGDPPKKTSRMAIVAIAFAVPGLCLFPLAMIGGVLGILVLVKGKELSSASRTLSIIAIVILPFSVFTTGILAAVAIPAFATYVRRAKTAEAYSNVKAIGQGLQRAYSQTGELPPSLTSTPEGAPNDIKRSWPIGSPAAQGFAAIGFAPAAPLYYVYDYQRSQDGRSFIVRALGDLDDDGTHSSFILEGKVEGKDIVLGERLTVENELE